MTLPVSGPVSLSQIRTELGLSGPVSLSNPLMRTLSGISGGGIPFSAMRGKSIGGRRPGEITFAEGMVVQNAPDSNGQVSWGFGDFLATEPVIIGGVTYGGGAFFESWNPPLDMGNGVVFQYHKIGIILAYNTGASGQEIYPSAQQLIDNSGRLNVNGTIIYRDAVAVDTKFGWVLATYPITNGLAGLMGQQLHIGVMP